MGLNPTRTTLDVSEYGTFELSHDLGEVVLELAVGGELQAHVVLGDPCEALRGVDAPLVQDAVDAEGCGGEALSSIKYQGFILFIAE